MTGYSMHGRSNRSTELKTGRGGLADRELAVHPVALTCGRSISIPVMSHLEAYLYLRQWAARPLSSIEVCRRKFFPICMIVALMVGAVTM
jgi:hypothetical protein